MDTGQCQSTLTKIRQELQITRDTLESRLTVALSESDIIDAKFLYTKLRTPQ